MSRIPGWPGPGPQSPPRIPPPNPLLEHRIGRDADWSDYILGAGVACILAGFFLVILAFAVRHW